LTEHATVKAKGPNEPSVAEVETAFATVSDVVP
jgi:hypothetical protein